MNSSIRIKSVHSLNFVMLLNEITTKLLEEMYSLGFCFAPKEASDLNVKL